MNNRGVSLLEIVIYITLFTIVSFLIGTQIDSMAKSFSGGTRISLLQTSSRDALSIVTREIKNTGFKSYLIPDGGSVKINTDNRAFYDDSSSFMHTEGDPGDKLTILKASINQSGAFSRVDTIEYSLENGAISRRAQDKVSRLANDIYALQFQYGILGASTLLLSEKVVSTSNWIATNCSKVASSPGLVIDVNGVSDVKVQCSIEISVTSSCRVAISYKVEQRGSSLVTDTLYWVFRSGDGTKLSVESFRLNPELKEVILPVKTFTNGLLSLEFRSKCTGSLYMEGIVVRKIENGEYIWVDNPTSLQKKYVKAIRLSVLARSKKSTSTQENSSVNVGNVVILRSGSFTWRMYTETIEIANNGMFN